MKHVLIYDYAPDSSALAAPHVADHMQLYLDAQARGDVLLAGPWQDDSGALAVFTSRAAADAFVAADPFVRHGVVECWRVREWNELLGE